MSLPQSWQEIVLIFTVLQGVLLLITFLISSSRAKFKKDRILWFFIFSLIILLINELSITSNFSLPIRQLIESMAKSVPLLYGPLLYHYTRAVLCKNSADWKWHHYNPAMLLFNLNMLSQIFEFSIWSMYGGAIFTLVSMLTFIQISIYLYYTLKAALSFKKEKEISSYFSSPYYYLITVLLLISFSFLLFFISFIAGLNGQVGVSVEYSEVWIVVSILTFLLSFFFRSNPDFFKEDHTFN